jgi:uncharacterized membrane protein
MKFFAILLCLLPAIAHAHKGHVHGLSVTAQAEAGVALKAAETAVISSAASISTGAQAATSIDWVKLFKVAIPSHLHNKVVHFPIALGIVGALFLLAGMKFEQFKSPGRWLLFLAALSSIVAVITGHAQEDDVEGAAMKHIMEVHEGIGTGLAIGLWLTWILSFMKSSYAWLWVLLILLVGALAVEGTLGGVLAHMQL